MLHSIPDDAVRVEPTGLRRMTADILLQMDLPEADAQLIADCLVQVDLRGVFSHGTRRLESYIKLYEAGQLNPRPHIRLVRDEANAVVWDGDGGLGYLVASRATRMLIDKTAASGLAVAATRHHGHVGSAGIYARMALERDLVSFAVAGGRNWQPPPQPGATVWDAMSSPPMCFAMPSAQGAPLVVDMSANFFRDRDRLEEAMVNFPEAVLKSMGLKFVSTVLGGFLAGALPEGQSSPWKAGGRGYFMLALKPDLVGDAAHFKAEVERAIGAARALEPIAGQPRAEVAGSPEWQRERDWAREGVPLAGEHRRQLEALAGRLGVELPW